MTFFGVSSLSDERSKINIDHAQVRNGKHLPWISADSVLWDRSIRSDIVQTFSIRSSKDHRLFQTQSKGNLLVVNVLITAIIVKILSRASGGGISLARHYRPKWLSVEVFGKNEKGNIFLFVSLVSRPRWKWEKPEKRQSSVVVETLFPVFLLFSSPCYDVVPLLLFHCLLNKHVARVGSACRSRFSFVSIKLLRNF